MTATDPARLRKPRSNTVLYIMLSLIAAGLLAVAVPLYIGIFQRASEPQTEPVQQPGPSENLTDLILSPHIVRPTINHTPADGFPFADRTLSPHGVPLGSVTRSISLLSPTSEIRVINVEIESPADDHGLHIANDTCSQTESLSKATSCHISLEWLPHRPGRLRDTVLNMEIRPPEPLPGQPVTGSWAAFRHVVPISGQLHPAPAPISVSMEPFEFGHPIPGETRSISRRLEVRNRPARILQIRRSAEVLSMQQAFRIETQDCKGTLTPPPGPEPAWCEITALWEPQPGSPALDAFVNVYYVEAGTPEHPEEGPRQILPVPVTSETGIDPAIPETHDPTTPGRAAWDLAAANFDEIHSGDPTRHIRARLYALDGPIRILEAPELFADTPLQRNGLSIQPRPCLQPGTIPAGHDCPMTIDWTIPSTATQLDANIILRWSADSDDALPQELVLTVTGSFTPPQPELLPIHDPVNTAQPATATTGDSRAQPNTPLLPEDDEGNKNATPGSDAGPAAPDDGDSTSPGPQPSAPIGAIRQQLEDTRQRSLPEPGAPEKQPRQTGGEPPAGTDPESSLAPDAAGAAATGAAQTQQQRHAAQSPSAQASHLELLAARNDLMRRRSIPVLDGGGIIRIDIPPDPRSSAPNWRDKDYTAIGIPKAPGESSRPVNLGATILAGTPIPAVLDLHIDARQPTPVTATVQRDIYAAHGDSIVIPRGSKVIGYTLAGAQLPGSTSAADTFNTAFAGRIQVHWNRIIRPDGAAFAPAAELRTADLMGRPGLPGTVNSRELSAFLSALSSIALQAGTTALLAEDITRIVSAQAGQTGTADVAGNLGQVISTPGSADTPASTTHTFRVTAEQQARQQARIALAEVLQSQFARALPPPPSVTAAAGSRMNLIPAVDLWLTPAIAPTAADPPAAEPETTPQNLTTTFPLTPEERNPSSSGSPDPLAPAPAPYIPPASLRDDYSAFEDPLLQQEFDAPAAGNGTLHQGTTQPSNGSFQSQDPPQPSGTGSLLLHAQPPATSPAWRR